MRKEVKIALTLVLVGVVVSAIYFFSDSEKTIEIAGPKPMGPSMDSPAPVQTPSGITPGTLTQAPRLEEPVAITPRSEPVVPVEKPVTPGGSRAVWTIDLEPLTNAPATRPARLTDKIRQTRSAEMESAANKVIPNQPISLEPELDADKSPTELTGIDVDKVDTKVSTATHIVKSGETFYQIAVQHYGRGDKWTLIAQANPKISPTKVQVGDKLFIPAASETVVGSTTTASVQKIGTDGAKTEKTSTASGKKRTYKVRFGDTLQVIAHDQLGSSARWREILKLNKKLGNDPMKLKANSTIVLPAK